MTSRDGKPGLLVTGVEKPYAPPIVQPLLLLDGSSFSGVNFSMGARITFLDLGTYRAELRNDVIVGSQYGINSQYYRPFTGHQQVVHRAQRVRQLPQYPIYEKRCFCFRVSQVIRRRRSSIRLRI